MCATATVAWFVTLHELGAPTSTWTTYVVFWPLYIGAELATWPKKERRDEA